MATAAVAAPALLGRPTLSRRLVVALALAATLAGTAAAADAPVATVTQVLAGIDDNAAGGLEPPDVQVAAGPGYVVELVNLAERVWRTDSKPAVQVLTRPLAAFFETGSDRLTDPRVAWDPLSGRWFASVSDIDAKAVLLAVSAAGDPAGAWTLSSYPAGGCADQPRLGIAGSTVVLAADVFNRCDENTGFLFGSELWVVNKQQLLAGSTTPTFRSFGPTDDRRSVSPVLSLSPTETEYAVSTDEGPSRLVHVLAVEGVPPADVSVRELASPAIRRLTDPPLAAQPPSRSRASPPIETNDERVLDAAWENGRLWFSANTSCTPPADPLVRACGRAVELSTTTLGVDWDVDLADAGANVFYPTLRPDGAGDLVVVYGESGVDAEPSLVASARLPDGTFTAPVVIERSPGPYLGSRYGDYFGAARDPGDPSVVWVAGEVGAEHAGQRSWTTAVASVVVTPAGRTPPASAVVPPPSLRAVRLARRVGRTVRLAYRALEEGTRVQAVVGVRDKAGKLVFHAATPPETIHTGRVYHLLWRSRKIPRGPLLYCVHSSSSVGDSPDSCARLTVG